MTPLASIPSPSSGTVELGPLSIHMYGLMLLLGIIACVALTGVRWVRGWAWRPEMEGIDDRQPHEFDLVLRVAVWGVAGGVVGARIYHVLTSWNEIPGPKWQGVFEVWKGGLGVWGGITLGTIVGAIIVYRSGNSVRLFMDAVAPGLLLAQGIGRWGNWWNQELFGKPTDLPWGLKIDPENWPIGKFYATGTTFHPTFLYEFTWDLAMVGVLIFVGWRFRIRPPALFALYVALYTFGRFFEELLRIDPAHEIGPLRLNAWVSIVVFFGSAGFFVWWQFFRRPGERQRRQERRRHVPKSPSMAIPKGRVRPSR